MFEKLFQLIKDNAEKAVINNPKIAEKNFESIVTEASSTIIDVMKSNIESGRLKDLVAFFQLKGIYNNNRIKLKNKIKLINLKFVQ